MEMSNNAAAVTADDAIEGSKYVYYNYVIAAADNNNATDDGDAHSSAIITYCDKMHVSLSPATNTTTTATTTAQQQYPMLVQQCIENCSGEDDPLKSADVQNNNHTTTTHLLENISQATLNVVLTAIDKQRLADESSETIIPDEIADFEEIDEELDDEDDYLDDEELEDDVAEDDYESESDLTSLAWLSDPAQSSAVNMLALGGVGVDRDDDHRPIAAVGKPIANETTTIRPKTPAAQPQQPQPSKKSKAPSKTSSQPQAAPVNDKNVTQERFNKFMLQVQQSQTVYASNATAYRNLTTEKPPFNYAQIIAMAMMECGRMTLKDICTWIRERFAFYRHQDNWNNSIRHNLSLHFCFTKIARDKTEKGKGGYWELSMNVTKGEKKRVRNRSKRALAILAATGQQPAAKRARRAAAVGKPKKVEAATAVTTMAETTTATTAISTMPSPTTEAQATTTTTKYVAANSIVAEYELQHYSDNELAASEAAATAVANELCAQFANGAEYAHIPANLLQDSEIFLGCEIPLSGDCIIIPYTSNCSSNQATTLIAAQPNHHQPLTLSIPTTTPNSPQSASSQPMDNASTSASPQQSAATFIAHGLTQTMGPNVIVEQMPYSVVATSAAATTQSVFDQVGDIERQFSSMAQLPDPDLVEYGVYFDYVNEW